MPSRERFLLIVPLCAAICALASLTWHTAPPGHRGHSGHMSRLRHLRGLKMHAAADGAWDSDGAAWWPDDGRGGATDDAMGDSAGAGNSADDGASTGDGASDGDKACADTPRRPHAPTAGAGSGDTADGAADEEAIDEEAIDEDDDAESTIEDEKRVGMCAAAASEQVQCVLNSGGGAQGECGTNKVAACLARLEIARTGPQAATVLVHTKYGRMVLPLADSFEGLALLLYGEWMEWGLGVLEHVVPKGATILDVSPGTGSVTLALAHMVGDSGRVLVSEPRPLFMQSLAASAQISGANLEFLPCLSSHEQVKDMLQLNASRATGMGKVLGADALRAHGRVPAACSTVDRRFAHDDAHPHLIRVSTCALHPWRAVLQGAARILRAHQPILYVESSGRGETAREVEDFLAGELGITDYRCYWSAGRMYREIGRAHV